jgi:hypothetical protein
VAIILNHLELVSTIFGATLVFKVLSNLLLKILLENSKKSSLFSFYSPIQNLLGVWSWSLNKSCRELNSKQLLFLGHFQKKSSSCSKWDFKTVNWNYLKIKLKKPFLTVAGAASLSARWPKRPGFLPCARPQQRRGPAHARAAFSLSRSRAPLSRPRQAAPAVWQAYAGDAGRVVPDGPRSPSPAPSVRAHSLLIHSLSSPATRVEPAHRLRPVTEHALAGVGCSDRLSSPL